MSGASPEPWRWCTSTPLRSSAIGWRSTGRRPYGTARSAEPRPRLPDGGRKRCAAVGGLLERPPATEAEQRVRQVPRRCWSSARTWTIFETADRIAVIFRGELSATYAAGRIDRERGGLVMPRVGETTTP